MTIPFLVDDLKTDEGYAKQLPDGNCQAYPDPKSGGEPWTIGYGCTGAGIAPGVVWTQDQATTELSNRCDALATSLDAALPWWRQLNEVRQAVIANMAYNMGVKGLLAFHNTLAAVQAGNYAAAADGMLASQWASDVKGRAVRLAAQMRSGTRDGALAPLF